MKEMVYLTKKVHFSASHTLKSGSLHGHNYVLEVTIQGEPAKTTGSFFGFERLEETIGEKILAHVHSKHLDGKSPFLSGEDPTAENLVKIFWKNLEPALPKGALYEIKLQKAESETVSYRGEV